jgi:tetratricopeptide (TPR) repeat protein
MPRRYAALLGLLLSTPLVHAQVAPLVAPDVSPHARVTQTVGITEVTLDYHRPGVNGREIWGALVPYGEVWRAGANENTVFEVSTDVAVDGEPLPAGRYGLHMIPTAGAWTVIFSAMDAAWGSFSYDEAEDALRVTVSPRPADFQERLAYRFDDPTNTSTEVVMHWEEVEVPFTVTVNTPEVVFASMERELRGLPRFFWQGWNQIAGYALQTETRMEDALEWVDRSIALNRNGTNLGTRMALLAALGREDEAEALEADFYATATENDVNTYGYVLLGVGRTDDAIAVFRRNVADYPESWNVHDSLGEALALAGQTAEAIEHYGHARSLAPEVQHARIDGILAQLRGAN